MFYFCFSRVLLTSLLHSFDSLGKTLLEDIGIVHMYGVASWRALVPPVWTWIHHTLKNSKWNATAGVLPP